MLAHGQDFHQSATQGSQLQQRIAFRCGGMFGRRHQQQLQPAQQLPATDHGDSLAQRLDAATEADADGVDQA